MLVFSLSYNAAHYNSKIELSIVAEKSKVQGEHKEKKRKKRKWKQIAVVRGLSTASPIILIK